VIPRTSRYQAVEKKSLSKEKIETLGGQCARHFDWFKGGIDGRLGDIRKKQTYLDWL